MHNRTHESRRSQNNNNDKRRQRGPTSSMNERETRQTNYHNEQSEFSPRDFRDLGDGDSSFVRENDFNARGYGNSPRFNEYDRTFNSQNGNWNDYDRQYRSSNRYGNQQRFGGQERGYDRAGFGGGYDRDPAAYDPWGEGEGWANYRGAYQTHGIETRPYETRGNDTPYYGKGPKGYKRSDERIREDVCDFLSEGHLDASDIEVSVQDGEVTLTGTVPSRAMKQKAEQCVERANGVKEVMNQLRVKAGAFENGDESRSGRTSTRPRHN